jgi:tetratricopeptide (TPR) repeat protein
LLTWLEKIEHLFRASAFMHLGLLDRAAAEATAAMDINPANLAEPLRVQGAAAMYAGKSSAAVPLLERASAESNAPAEWNLAYAYHNAGRKDEAEAMLRRIRGRSARSQRRAQATLASFLAADGRTTEAAELIDVVIAGSYMDHHVAATKLATGDIRRAGGLEDLRLAPSNRPGSERPVRCWAVVIWRGSRNAPSNHRLPGDSRRTTVGHVPLFAWCVTLPSSHAIRRGTCTRRCR